MAASGVQEPEAPDASAAPTALIFGTSFAVLAVEVFYSRLFSILLWSNTAFAVLSMAMIGIGVAGVAVYCWPRLRDIAIDRTLAPAFAASILLSYLWLLYLSRTPYSAWSPILGFAVFTVAALLPFFFGGLILSSAFARYSARISQLYFWDLAGAALGAVALLPALYLLNGPAVVPAIGLVVVACNAPFVWRRRDDMRAVLPTLLVGAALAGAFALQSSAGVLDLQHTKGRRDRDIVAQRWDPLGRVTVQRLARDAAFLWIDGAVGTTAMRYRGLASQRRFLRRSVLQLAYRLDRFERVLIIGPGGGNDLLAAKLSGARAVTGVEVNRSIANLMRTTLGSFSGNVYGMPGVTVHVGDGRAFVAAMTRTVDLIQATFIDTYATAVAGTHTLAENYLYTVEAMRDFLAHVAPKRGMVSVSRWGGTFLGFEETYRMVTIAARALAVAHPERHIVVAQETRRMHGAAGAIDDGKSRATVLVRRAPFTSAQLQRLGKVAAASGFRLLWHTGIKRPDPVIAGFFAAKDKRAFFLRYRQRTGLDISPSRDDRPFFFQFTDPLQFLATTEKPAWNKSRYYRRMKSEMSVLAQLCAATAGLVVLLVAVPLGLRSKKLRGARHAGRSLLYFACLGVGFIGIELGMVQRFSLFLGHPAYSLVVVLAGILLFGGLGSLSTRAVEQARAARGALWRLALLLGVLGLYGLLLPTMLARLIAWPMAAKLAVCLALVFAPAYLMGMAFPLGIKACSDSLVPWLWGLNSGFSVFGATLSLALALSFGYSAGWAAFTGCYAVAALCMALAARSSR